MNPTLKKILLVLGGIVAVIVVVRVFNRLTAAKNFLADNPTKDLQETAAASAMGDALSLRAMREVMPPSAQGVRATVAQTDLNPIGGVAVPLVTVDRFSPFNW